MTSLKRSSDEPSGPPKRTAVVDESIPNALLISIETEDGGECVTFPVVRDDSWFPEGFDKVYGKYGESEIGDDDELRAAVIRQIYHVLPVGKFCALDRLSPAMRHTELAKMTDEEVAKHMPNKDALDSKGTFLPLARYWHVHIYYWN